MGARFFRLFQILMSSQAKQAAAIATSSAKSARRRTNNVKVIAGKRRGKRATAPDVSKVGPSHLKSLGWGQVQEFEAIYYIYDSEDIHVYKKAPQTKLFTNQANNVYGLTTVSKPTITTEKQLEALGDEVAHLVADDLSFMNLQNQIQSLQANLPSAEQSAAAAASTDKKKFNF